MLAAPLPLPPPPTARTIVGVSVRADGSAVELPPALHEPPPPPKASRTIVGMPNPNPRGAEPAKPARRDPPRDPARTAVLGTPAVSAPKAGATRSGSTLVGVARPGIAPVAPGAPPAPPPPAPPPPVQSQQRAEPEPRRPEPVRELGATAGAEALREIRPPPGWEEEKKKRQRRVVALPAMARRAPAAPPGDEPISRRALAVVLAAGGLALVAVLVALFWPSPPPLTARPRADSSGREGVELTCKSCPDGTTVSIEAASATVTGGVALIPLPAALSVGPNRFKVSIDRPGNGRDETVSVVVHVAYRIRPDLAALQAERPAFQIVAEAASGTTVTIDGRPVPLASGRGVESIDVAEVCSGLANEVKTLARQIPYQITPDSGPVEQGVVNVSVGIVPLHLDAPVAIVPASGGPGPQPHVLIEAQSFVLAGWTMKGAEVLAAGRPITVHPDGTFAQVMNVSSAGATQIEVRARMAGMAPRLSSIKVRRVDSLEKAARDFGAGEQTVSYPLLVTDVAGSLGKAITLTGEVAEAKKQGYQTVMLLEVGAASGCAAGACTVRLVQGAENAARRGDTLRVFGHVSRAFTLPGRSDVPEIEVDFTLKAGAASAPPAGKGAK
jgi:hypothetical protein